MTGPNWVRRAVALAGALAAGGCVPGGTAVLSAGSAALVARFDADRDGTLDESEVTAMVGKAVRGEGAAADALRAALVAGYRALDRDGDGRLTAAELGR